MEQDELLKSGISIFVERSGERFYGSMSIANGLATIVLLVNDDEEVHEVPESNVHYLDVVDKEGNVQVSPSGLHPGPQRVH